MPQYIMLVNFTDQGLRGVKDVAGDAAAHTPIQNISGLPQGLAGRPAAGWRCGRLSARASRRRNA
jgi:hypothetical protein